MNEFERYNPIVNFLYFVAVIVFAMIFMHPICLAISLVCSFSYSIMLNGKRAVKFNFCLLNPMMIIAALINPAFNHEGVTIIEYLPSGNPLTLESILYGLAAAVMLCNVICWFSCYNKIMTSDKFIYLFGRIIPSLSLVLSMTLRFIPNFKAQIKVVSQAQRCVGRDVSQGSIIKRARNGITILSIMITWALENSIETARSMKSRGYGLHGRSAFAIFDFDKRDTKTLIYILVLSAYIVIGASIGGISFRYFPSLKSTSISALSISIFVAYFMLCTMPIIIEIIEVRKWNVIKSKI
jgi:energy-coupling factor transport system permease protein